MAVNPFQYQYAGLLLGDGTSYEVVKVVGLDDLPNLRNQSVSRARDHGYWFGGKFADTRLVQFEVDIVGVDDATFRANVEALTAATVIVQAESALVFQLPGMAGNRQLNCVPIKRMLPAEINYRFHAGRATVWFEAVDPRIYDATLQSFTIPVGVPASGLSFNATPNFTFGTGGTTGVVTATNAGNFATRPVVVINGPVDNPTIENTTAGKHLTFAISLLNTDTLTVDLDARSVLLNGTASRRSTMSTDSQWWEIAPGNSQITYRANTVQVGSTAVLSFRSAWL